MDLALGVAVAGPVARLALIESGTGGHGVIDESVVDLAEDPIARLTETVVGTNRSLADQYHRLVSTRLCWSDQRRADSAAAGVGRLRRSERRGGVRVSGSNGIGAHPFWRPTRARFGCAACRR